jgi:type I restriction enzyme S subunit
MHVGRDEVLPVALYRDDYPAIVSPAYLTFEMVPESGVDPEYLMMFFQRPEFDRFIWFVSDSSVRGALEWQRFLELQIPVLRDSVSASSIVNLSSSLQTLRRSLESTQADLELALEASLARHMNSGTLEKVGTLIQQSEERNPGFDLNRVRGISINKEFIKSKANLVDVDVADYKLVRSGEIAYVTVTSRNGEKISIALNKGPEILVSKTYVVFRVRDNVDLLPEYLFLWFRRPGFDRYARFHSWGSARETFEWNELCEVSIPVPPLHEQLSIVKIFRSLEDRRKAHRDVIEAQKRASRVIYAGILSGKIESVA